MRNSRLQLSPGEIQLTPPAKSNRHGNRPFPPGSSLSWPLPLWAEPCSRYRGCSFEAVVYLLKPGPSSCLGSTSTSSPAHILMLGDHTIAMLSSAELARVHVSDSPGAQQKSVGGAVCPPWTKSNSGGPSSASSGVCSWPMRLRSHMLIRRSEEAEANTVGECGDHAKWRTSCV